jgi:hypothetical protein
MAVYCGNDYEVVVSKFRKSYLGLLVMDFVDIFVEVFCVEESVDPIEKEII